MIRRFLLRIGWYHAYQCKQCGYLTDTASPITLARLMVEHYEDAHDDLLGELL